jgi:preprotein translocase subunit SecF
MNIINKRFIFFWISILFILAGVVSLIVNGLPMGIEFSGGSLLTIKFDQQVDQSALKAELTTLGHSEAIVQRASGTGEYFIQLPEMSDQALTDIQNDLSTKFGKLTGGFETISPQVAPATGRNALYAVAITSIGILLYLTWAFRRMSKPWRWGTAAVIALIHDVLVAVGIFSIFGAILNWQINLMFITGILTVIGYSINNTIIVFDRIRENEIRGISPDFEVVVNNSVVETIGRSMNTNFTTLITILALLLFVGSTIQNFVIVVMIGLIAGTFDSICVAPSLLVVWEKGEWGRFLHPFSKA